MMRRPAYLHGAGWLVVAVIAALAVESALFWPLQVFRPPWLAAVGWLTAALITAAARADWLTAASEGNPPDSPPPARTEAPGAAPEQGEPKAALQDLPEWFREHMDERWEP